MGNKNMEKKWIYVTWIQTAYKLCYMNTEKTKDIYSDFTKDVETRSDTSNYQLDRPLPKGKNKKVVGLTEDVLDAKMKKKL